MSKIKPLGDRVLIKVLDPEEKTKGGIIIPDTAKEKPQQGKVVAVGTGKVKKDGTRIPMELKEGDKVLFSKYSGNEFTTAEGEELLVIKEEDILAVFA
ncbi:MAG: co-chaperone GroES [Candidatus Omnitrophota bacterium]